jgi:predicted dehydrogenase
MQEINIGIIGCGLLGNTHLMALETIIQEKYFVSQANIQIKALCDVNEKHLRQYGADHKIQNLYVDYHQLLADPAINTVYIATPTAFHKEIFQAAAELGKDIFIEKPVTDPPEMIRNLIKTRDQNKIITQVGLDMRHDPLIWYIKQLISDPINQKAWGALQNVIFRDDQDKPYTGSGTHPSTWRRNPQLAYHGTLFEHSIHDIDVMQFWFGPITEVHARIKFFAKIIPIEDSVCASFELSNGASASLHSIWHNIIGHDTRLFEMFWENLYLKLEYGTASGNATIVELNKKSRSISSREADKAYRQAMGIADHGTFWLGDYGYENVAFLKSVITRQPAQPGLEEAFQAHRVVECCYQSAVANRIVRV